MPTSAAQRTHLAHELMLVFADRTGVTSNREPRRYLWTDAFAVCNLLGIERATGDGRCRELALQLIDRVHHVLGRHRGDDRRSGWLSGLAGAEAEAHPTRGGLRIGKPLPERRADEPEDPRLEWDRDGQYFHYLTRWMHALDQATRATGQPLFNLWACELADVAHRAFTRPAGAGGRPRMIWKASIDLSRPLVASMGQHDPLDGLVTCVQLADTARRTGAPGPDLAAARADFARLLEPAHLATADPLGLGGLLIDAFRLEQLGDAALAGAVVAAALPGLDELAAGPELRQPAARRLAFRELGLAIGLAAAARLTAPALRRPLEPYLPLAGDLLSFWLAREHRGATWLAHQDINDVMLATALAPDGYLVLTGP